MTKVELKKLAKDALQYNLGFSPANNDVILLEYGATGNTIFDVDYLLFEIRGRENFNYRLSRNYLKNNYYEVQIVRMDNNNWNDEFELSTNR